MQTRGRGDGETRGRLTILHSAFRIHHSRRGQAPFPTCELAEIDPRLVEQPFFVHGVKDPVLPDCGTFCSPQAN